MCAYDGIDPSEALLARLLGELLSSNAVSTLAKEAKGGSRQFHGVISRKEDEKEYYESLLKDRCD